MLIVLPGITCNLVSKLLIWALLEKTTYICTTGYLYQNVNGNGYCSHTQYI